MVEGMKQHPGQAGVQQQGCWALRNLGRDAENQVKIAAAGGIQVVVGAMTQHPGAAGVQQYGCWALCNLAVNNDDIRAQVVSGGGREAAERAMKQHPGAAGVQEWGKKLCDKLA